MTDFINTYQKIKNSLVTISTDDGLSLSSSSGFIVNHKGENYIVTTAHSVMKDISIWGMDQVLYVDDASDQCDNYVSIKDLSLPAGKQKLILRFIPNDYDSRIFFDKITIFDENGTVFEDSFSSTIKPDWSFSSNINWILKGGKGKFLSKAITIDDFQNASNRIANLYLDLDLTESASLSLNYKINCARGIFIIGVCSGGCDSRIAEYINGTYGDEIHPLRVIALDGRGDIAVCVPDDNSSLKSLKPIPLATVIPAIASPIATVGNPLAMDPCSISTGVVRDNKFNPQSSQLVESLLTSSPSFVGNSGCPYITLDGKVAGMLAWGMTETDSTFNGGPTVNVIRRVLNSIKRDDFIDYPKAYTGLNLYGIDANIISQLSLPMYGTKPKYKPAGYLVTSIETDSPLRSVIKDFDVLMQIQESGKPSTSKKLGSFQGQSSIAELTWTISPASKVDIMLLRFNQDKNQWDELLLTQQQLTSYPLEKDIPYSSTLMKIDKHSNKEPLITVLKTLKNRSTYQARYKMSKEI